MGKHLSDIEAIPDVIFSSPGLRALTTARLIAVEIGIKPKDIVLKDDLYTFSHSDLLEFIYSMDDKYATVMLVGHNPAITDTLNFLCGTNIDNVPTCGVAIMKLSVDSWGKLNKNKAELMSFDYPKKLW